MCYSDEKWFVADAGKKGKIWVLDKNDHRQWKGKKAHPTKIMFLGAISKWGTPPLVEVDGKMDQVQYTAYLEEVFKPWLAENVPGQPIWLQDNPPVHKAQFVLQKILCFGWQLAEHPPQSPDLNPIETAWHYVDILLKEYVVNSKAELRQAVQECWKIAGAAAMFEKYIKRLQCNIDNVIRLGGGNQYKENRCKRAVVY